MHNPQSPPNTSNYSPVRAPPITPWSLKIGNDKTIPKLKCPWWLRQCDKSMIWTHTDQKDPTQDEEVIQRQPFRHRVQSRFCLIIKWHQGHNLWQMCTYTRTQSQTKKLNSSLMLSRQVSVRNTKILSYCGSKEPLFSGSKRCHGCHINWYSPSTAHVQ